MAHSLSLAEIEQARLGTAYLFSSTGQSIDLVGSYQGKGWFRGITTEQRPHFVAGKVIGSLLTVRQVVHEHFECTQPTSQFPNRIGYGLKPSCEVGFIEPSLEPAAFTLQALSLTISCYTRCVKEQSTELYAGLNHAEAIERVELYKEILEAVNNNQLEINTTTGSVFVDLT